MQPQIINKPAFTVAGILIHTKPMSPEIPALWPQFVARMEEIHHVAEPGVTYGLMGNWDDTTGLFDYMAGQAVGETADLPADMTQWNVPANTYAVFETTLPAINETFGYIYNSWLPASGYQALSAPNFEYYGETFNPDDPASKLFIYIPVEKKAD